MKYGFVYIWYDRKHKRYYIGAHWGTEDDGYICSSPWMKQAYTKRPGDFKRRILVRIHTNRQDMFNEEARWQALIKDHELKGVRYYNIKRHGDRHWSTDINKTLSVKEKLKTADNTKGLRNYAAKIKGTKRSEAFKQRISLKLKGRKQTWECSAELRQKRSDNGKRLQAEGLIGMTDRIHSKQTKQLMSINNSMNNPEYRSKARAAKRGAVCLTLDGKRKFAQLNTPLYECLIEAGFKPTNKKSNRYNTKEEANRGRSEALKGHGVSAQTKEKMRISRLLYIERQKAGL
jgi:hypothetical protein